MDPSKSKVSGRQSRRALLVDDDRLMLSVVGDMLHDLGVEEVVTGASGVAGIQAFERMLPAPDFVVCDLNMPSGDGFQFMEQLGQHGYAGGVVVMSGLASRVLNSAALMARFHGLRILATLGKPVDEASLRAALSGQL